MLYRAFLLFAFSSLLVVSSSAYSREYGVAIYQSYLEHSFGDTESTELSQVSFANGFFADKLSFDTRYWVEGFWQKGVRAASSDIPGEDIQIYGIASAWQTQFRLTKSIKPWAGAGVSYSIIDISARHTVDSEGFLLKKLDDVSEQSTEVFLNVSNFWDISNRLGGGVVLRYMPRFLGDVSMFSVGVAVVFQ